MSYYGQMRTIIVFVESHIYEKHIDYKVLEQAVGFSMAHIRDIFMKQTGVPLMKYVMMRKVMNSCFDLLYTKSRIVDIAFKYGFENHETYSRAFKRIIGLSPIAFRRDRPGVGKSRLIGGIYGLSLLKKNNKVMEEICMAENEVKGEACILYGVPKVGYGIYGCTPYPICLKSCANYLGEDIAYDFAMVASGAAFRMTWDRTQWNLGNVDIYTAFDEHNKAYEIGPKALGRSFEFLERTAETKKEEFIDFIKQHIDAGLPCMALGIIGPPEACIITGYQNNGNTLLGWNFFQDNVESGSSVRTHECGYFICEDWWENKDTQAVMCMGEIVGEKALLREIVQNAIKVLTGREHDIYSKGINAYDSWAKAVLDEKSFSEGDNLALLHEKVMCQDDAVSCLVDGRGNAAKFFADRAEKSEKYKCMMYEIAKAFDEVYHLTNEMNEILGGWNKQEADIQRFAKTEVRKQIASLIQRAKASDTRGLEALVKLEKVLGE